VDLEFGPRRLGPRLGPRVGPRARARPRRCQEPGQSGRSSPGTAAT